MSQNSELKALLGRLGPVRVISHDLPALQVHLERRRAFPEPATFLSEIRARHRLSQRDFADALGFDVRTLQNWEQGRNTPDRAVLLLAALFDRDPDSVTRMVFEPVAVRAPVPAG